MKRNIALGVGLLAAALFAVPSAKADGIFTAVLLGTNEATPNASPGSGGATLTLTGDLLKVDETFTNLMAPAAAAHIHCCAGPGVVAVVAIPFSGFPPATSGSYINTFDLSLAVTYTGGFLTAHGGTAATAEAALVAALIAGNAYVNIHDAAFPGGEIRGQLAQVTTPEPDSLLPLATGLLGLVGAARRKVLA